MPDEPAYLDVDVLLHPPRVKNQWQPRRIRMTFDELKEFLDAHTADRKAHLPIQRSIDSPPHHVDIVALRVGNHQWTALRGWELTVERA